MRSTAAIALVLLAAPPAFAQEPRVAEKLATEKQAAEMATRVPLEAPVKGAPYSADVIVESTQTLADGNHISNKSVGHVCRDGEGRIRREQEGTMSVVTRSEPVVTTKKMQISIVDPVAGYSYSLNPEQKIAYRTPIGTSKELLDKINFAAAQRSSQPTTDEQKVRVVEDLKKLKVAAEERAAQSNDAPSKASSEVIARSGGGGRGGFVASVYTPPGPPEHATIEGLAVEGHKTSETIPAGRIGNELPITITAEEWRSPELKVLVLTKHSDPRTGESTYRLTNVVRAEPDPSYFMVPPDYTVKDTNIRRNNE